MKRAGRYPSSSSCLFLNDGPDQLAGDGFHDDHPLSLFVFFLSRGGVLNSACVMLFTITSLWIRCVCQSRCLLGARFISWSGQDRTVAGYGDAAESQSPLPTTEVSEDLRLAAWKVSVRWRRPSCKPFSSQNFNSVRNTRFCLRQYIYWFVSEITDATRVRTILSRLFATRGRKFLSGALTSCVH